MKKLAWISPRLFWTFRGLSRLIQIKHWKSAIIYPIHTSRNRECSSEYAFSARQTSNRECSSEYACLPVEWSVFSRIHDEFIISPYGYGRCQQLSHVGSGVLGLHARWLRSFRAHFSSFEETQTSKVHLSSEDSFSPIMVNKKSGQRWNPFYRYLLRHQVRKRGPNVQRCSFMVVWHQVHGQTNIEQYGDDIPMVYLLRGF